MAAISNRQGPFVGAIAELRFGSAARILLFDQLRGLLLFRMILGRAHFLTGSPAEFPLKFLHLGPATDSFAMLTGFVITRIFVSRSYEPAQVTRSLRRAAFALAIVYSGNLGFAVARDLAAGDVLPPVPIQLRFPPQES